MAGVDDWDVLENRVQYESFRLIIPLSSVLIAWAAVCHILSTLLKVPSSKDFQQQFPVPHLTLTLGILKMMKATSSI
jgi:hypothetical protein